MSVPVLALSAVLALTVSPAPAHLIVQQTQNAKEPLTVLTGCLRQSRADTTTANAKGVIYTLEARAQKLPTSPAPEGSGPIKADGRYALSFEESVDLSKLVNHQVEVRGHRLPRGASDAKGAAASAAAAKPLPGAADQMFHVTAVKMLAPRCD